MNTMPETSAPPQAIQPPAARVRYQGAILRGRLILLVQHRNHTDGRSYWLLPGGGKEAGESDTQCVAREMREETGLEVQVAELLLAESPVPAHSLRKTYRCIPLGGEAQPGYEPEPEVAVQYAIAAVRWLDLDDPATWGEAVTADPFTYPELLAIRAALEAPHKVTPISS